MPPDEDLPRDTAPTSDPATERRTELRKALDRHAKKLERKLEALGGDLAEAGRGAEWRRYGETLLAYAHLVPPRSASVTLADASDPDSQLVIELDPSVAAPANAARYFKRAAKSERALREIPPRIEALRAEITELRRKLRVAADAERAVTSADAATVDASDAAQLELERVLATLSFGTRKQLSAPEPLPRRKLGLAAQEAPKPAAIKSPTTAAIVRQGKQSHVPAKFVPWRFRSLEGWDVLIGRSSEANDHLTLHIARPEDYWFHAHGCPGSHVVLRRGKGANEPSKQTLEEVASWAAYHSKSRTAGKVPVIYTQKKYVRKPRGTKAGTVYVEREKMIMVRPAEPPRAQMSDQPQGAPPPEFEE